MVFTTALVSGVVHHWLVVSNTRSRVQETSEETDGREDGADNIVERRDWRRNVCDGCPGDWCCEDKLWKLNSESGG